MFYRSVFVLVSILYLSCDSLNSNSISNTVIYKKYKKNGDLLSIITLDTISGIKHTEIYYNDSFLKEKYTSVNGKRNGEHSLYHHNGNIKSKSNVKDGKFEGPIHYYYSDGTLEQKGEHKNGIRVGDTFHYNKNGTLSKYSYYIDNIAYFQKKYEYGKDGNLTNVISFHEMYIEIKDTVKSNKEFDVYLELIKKDSSTCHGYIAYLDLIDAYNFDKKKKLPFPKLKEIEFDSGKVKDSVKVKIPNKGKYYIYGILKYKDNDTNKEEIVKFKDSLFVVNTIEI